MNKLKYASCFLTVLLFFVSSFYADEPKLNDICNVDLIYNSKQELQ